MTQLAGLIFGPLAGPECRRAVARGWLILVRALAGVAVFGAVGLALWAWWINQQLDPNYLPVLETRIGLAVVEGMLVTVALVMAPAVLAGSLAGERERGALGLLLTTCVSAREIVTGRLLGKLAQVGMIVLTGVPAVIGMATLCGFSPWTVGINLVLPLAVGFGAGGLAVFASTVSRRGRDALLSVFLVELLLMLTPLLRMAGSWTSGEEWVGAANPYAALQPLVFREDAGIAGLSIGFWLILGLVGACGATWRLRPICLAMGSGTRVASNRGRVGYVPGVSETRPMVWKELFIERAGTLGKFGRWVGFALSSALIGGCVGLSAVLVWNAARPGNPEWADWAIEMLAVYVGGSGWWLVTLIEFAVGLRAGVSISSERERGTWDALLTSPLDGGEIVRGKLWGSLYALRGLIVASFAAWVLAAAAGAVPVGEAVEWGADVIVVGAFMAAVGVRTSLVCQTATRAMALTIGIRLGAFVVVGFFAFLGLVAVTLLGNAARMALGEMGVMPPQTAFWAPVRFVIAWPVARGIGYALATLLIVADTRLRFDRLAGRMTEGRAAVAVEGWVYGRPEAPVLLADGIKIEDEEFIHR